MSNKGFIVTGPDGSGPGGLFQLLAVRGALRLEKVGLKSRGGSIRKAWALQMGLKANAKHDEVIAAIEKRLAEIKQNGDYEVREL